jgi:hypothetical protein
MMGILCVAGHHSSVSQLCFLRSLDGGRPKIPSMNVEDTLVTHSWPREAAGVRPWPVGSYVDPY